MSVVALPAVVRRSRSLLALLGVPLTISCFNPGQDAPLTTTAGLDPTTGTEGSSGTTGDSTAEPGSGGATMGMTSSEPADSTGSGPAECGNRIVEGDEECDDGPANGDTAACKADCTLPSCGDGLVWEGEEECDDGDDDDSDECPTTCLNATCGDGFIQIEEEECDSDELGNGSCADFGLSGELSCTAQCGFDTSDCSAGCPDGGAFVSGMCWYLSAGCEVTNVTCGNHGLVGIDGYIPTAWDMATMQAIAGHYGWGVGGDIACCVEFGWVDNNALYTHNFGPQFYNWPDCYDVFPTLKACSPP